MMQGELAGRQYMTQEATLRGDVEEVAVRGAQLHLAIPPACAGVAVAVRSIDEVAHDGRATLSQDSRETLSRLKELLREL